MLGTNGADPAITGYHSCSLVANCLRFESSNMDGGSMMLLAFFFLLSPTARMAPDAESCINRQGLCQITIGHGLAWANCHPPAVAYETLQLSGLTVKLKC